MKHGEDNRDLSEFFPNPVPKAKDPQPSAWPSPEQRRTMVKTYGRVLTWDEYQFRAGRFVADADELAYKDGHLGRHR